MGIQKYRADTAGPAEANGAVPYYSQWLGGPSLALIRNCPIKGIPEAGHRTVYITGEPDSFFSQPARIQYQGRTVRGWISRDESGFTFHANR